MALFLWQLTIRRIKSVQKKYKVFFYLWKVEIAFIRELIKKFLTFAMYSTLFVTANHKAVATMSWGDAN